MIRAVLVALALVLFVPTPAQAAGPVRVDSLAELQQAIDAAQPGARIELADGTYVAENPIAISGKSDLTIAAAKVGRAEITGPRSFTFSGSHHVVLRGFKLTSKQTLRVPSSSTHVRITRNHFEMTTAADGDHWLGVDGDDAEIDHNTFANKTNLGVYLPISGPDGKIAQRTWIHHNYFFNHQFTGDNGGEPIRLGLSSKQLLTANAVVEYNLFDKVDGDPEAISVKSSDNVIRYNTIIRSEGSIVLRHGNRNRVEGNLMFGGRSGIRFYGNDHVIVNNQVRDSAGSGIVIGSGSVVDDTTSTGNDRPDRVLVAFNTLVGNAVSITGEGNRPLEPHDCVVANNAVVGSGAKLVTMPRGEVGFRWEGNLLSGAPGGDLPAEGFRALNPRLSADSSGIYRPIGRSPAIDAAVGSYPQVTLDVDRLARTGAKDVGADERRPGGPRRHPLTTADVGPLAP